MDLKAHISSYLPSLTKSEQKVAQVVLEQSPEVLYFSVTELAEYADVGETTVMRFCRKIGFKGYQDFRLSLAQDQNALRVETQQADPLDYVQMLYQSAVHVLNASVALLDREKLNQAVELIDQAKRVQFFGVGASAITALDAKNRLMRIGCITEAITDSHMQAMSAVLMGPGDVAVGVSVTGSTKDTNDMLAKAKQNGAKVIAITNYAKSPITGIADIVLLTAGKESPLEGGSIAAKMSQLFVIDLICEGIARRDEAKTKSMKEKTARAVIDRIY
ncbi:MurR/RpiR family transcriptional regulator [Paenibacillus gansuensis]|uniref:MurR/RpiR family transcriptional regulator n=1 Tax=Paenibacillus gansuensis TaxID=306542 RepID=A0ABW5PKD7_9BACL